MKNSWPTTAPTREVVSEALPSEQFLIFSALTEIDPLSYLVVLGPGLPSTLNPSLLLLASRGLGFSYVMSFRFYLLF